MSDNFFNSNPANVLLKGANVPSGNNSGGTITVGGGDNTDSGGTGPGGDVIINAGNSISGLGTGGNVQINGGLGLGSGGASGGNLTVTLNGNTALVMSGTPDPSFPPDLLDMALGSGARATLSLSSFGTFFDMMRDTTGNRNLVAINADISDSDGPGNIHDIGRDTLNQTYPYRNLYLGTSQLIGATTGSSATPNYQLQIRDAGANAVYTQFTNSATTDASNTGLLVGIDSSGNAVLNNQPNTVPDVNAAPSLTIQGSDKSDPSSTGDGGAIQITAGGSFGGVGGQIGITAGSALGTVVDGGSIHFTGGAAGTTGDGGSVNITGGAAPGTGGIGGNISLFLGAGTTPGAFNLYDATQSATFLRTLLLVSNGFVSVSSDFISENGNRSIGLVQRNFSGFSVIASSHNLVTDASSGHTEPADNYHVDLRSEVGINPVYQQWANVSTGLGSTNGLIIGIDADGNAIFNNQPNGAADSATAPNVTINASNKTAGTGNGGSIILEAGTSDGGHGGDIRISSGNSGSGDGGGVYFDTGSSNTPGYVFSLQSLPLLNLGFDHVSGQALVISGDDNIGTRPAYMGVSTLMSLDFTTLSSQFVMRSAREDGSSNPQSLQSGDAIGSVSFQGFASAVPYINTAQIAAFTAEDWSTTSTYGSELLFQTIPVGSTTLTTALSIDGTQTVKVPVALSVNGYKDAGSETNLGSSGTALTIDFSTNNTFVTTLTGTCVVTLNGPRSGGAYIIRIINDGTHSITWPGSVTWLNSGNVPPGPTTNGFITLVNLYYDSTNYWGSFAAQT
jgi:hypothetical protein